MSKNNLDRRLLIKSSMALGGLCLAGGASPAFSLARRKGASSQTLLGLSRPLAPIRALPDRVINITVCLRPFRQAGPRIETEQIGDTLVVHNYGHGASGWSLSWGSANLAIQKALVNSPTHIAVVGCGIIGLTSALMAQRAGAQVTIYARDLLPQTRSSRAQAFWGPGGGGGVRGMVPQGFVEQMEQMSRFSFRSFVQYGGFPGMPVEWRDQYALSDTPFNEIPRAAANTQEPEFVNYSSNLSDLMPKAQELPEGSTPFPVKYVRRSESMIFNIPEFSHLLMKDFYMAGGKFVRRVFHTPNDLTSLPEKTVINCPGYEARQWWRDSSITPRRGQINWLAPQSEVDYGLNYKGVLVTSRRDAIGVQGHFGGDWNNSSEMPDRAESDRSVSVLTELFSRFGNLSSQH